MRLLWARGRAMVHATEDEQRVRDALLWTLAQLGRPGAEHIVERRRAKGHYGNDILLLEAAVKGEADVAAALRSLLDDASTRTTVRESLARRLDEEHVLHVRLDKQAAVQRRIRLAETGEVIVARFKAVPAPGENPVRAWARLVDPTPA